MYNELLLCFKICRILNRKYKLDSNKLNTIAFDIFFFGIESNFFIRNLKEISKEKGSDIINTFKSNFKNIRKQHEDNNGSDTEYKLKDSNIVFKIKLKYLPFSGHENKLGHFYRHLFYTVKYIVNKEKEGLITYKQAREYLKLLRAQMSNYENVLLYYNYIIGYGKDWENEGFLTKYRMLHNLPLDKTLNVSQPRRHFKEFIKTIKPDETPMFEWGDYD